ncbi:DUF5780 domain-containing protein [Sporosarcina sp. Marseille-Q4943]|uniref:DUF5780 domain-containing protein n=1 Tax=Sporosarcina sp. Marseille-Q4943 TaxID=2942204 RepID=UPI00208DBDE6|nr:DUF5780 domain-containing protein [Sporosarcina sp. Marseille-Q4943]
MRCNSCGAENQKDSVYCNKCGTNLSQSIGKEKDSSNTYIAKRNTMRSKKVIFGSTISLIIMVSILLFFYINNPVNAFKSEINSNNDKAALDIYEKKINGKVDNETKAKSFLIEEAKQVKESFKNQQIDYGDAKEKLDTIKNTRLVSSDVNKINAYIKQLHDSRIAFEKAREYQKEKNYSSAIREYQKVIKEDDNYSAANGEIKDIKEKYKKEVLSEVEENINSKDYDSAVTLLKEASLVISDDKDIISKLAIYKEKLDEQKAIQKREEIEKAKAEQIVVVESSKIFVQSTEYKALYPDMIQVIVKNKSDKTIKSMSIGSVGYDKNGYPVKIKTQYSFSDGNYEFVGNGEDVNIVAGGTYGQDVGWSLDDRHGISKTISCVKSVSFYDGTTWENPYYSYWIEEYKGKPLN